MATQTFLEDINVLELSPTAIPATRLGKIYQKSASKEIPMFNVKTVEEYLAKCGMSAEDKVTAKTAIESLASLKVPSGEIAAFKAAMDMPTEEEDDEEEKEKEVAEEVAKATKPMMDCIKKSVELLDSASPAVMPALESLAKIAGVEVKTRAPSFPPEARAEIEALRKSADAANNALVEMQKSMLEKEYLAKAATWPHVPMSTEEIAKLAMSVPATDKLFEMFDKVEQAVAKSAALQEYGTAASPRAGSALQKINEIAAQMVAKSSTAMTPEQAFTAAITANPALYTDYLAEREAERR